MSGMSLLRSAALHSAVLARALLLHLGLCVTGLGLLLARFALCHGTVSVLTCMSEQRHLL